MTAETRSPVYEVYLLQAIKSLTDQMPQTVDALQRATQIGVNRRDLDAFTTGKLYPRKLFEGASDERMVAALPEQMVVTLQHRAMPKGKSPERDHVFLTIDTSGGTPGAMGSLAAPMDNTMRQTLRTLAGNVGEVTIPRTGVVSNAIHYEDFERLQRNLKRALEEAQERMERARRDEGAAHENGGSRVSNGLIAARQMRGEILAGQAFELNDAAKAFAK